MTLNWLAPMTNQDGTPLADLAGFRVHYGTATGNYSKTVAIDSPSTLTYTLSNLPASTYYAMITAVDKNGNESPPSPEVSKTIK